MIHTRACKEDSFQKTLKLVHIIPNILTYLFIYLFIVSVYLSLSRHISYWDT
jgi:hypothetical protein